jgi:hypothetical protein
MDMNWAIERGATSRAATYAQDGFNAAMGSGSLARWDSRLVLRFRLNRFVSAMRVAIRLPCIAPAGSHHCKLLRMGRRGTVDSCAGRNRTRALATH